MRIIAGAYKGRRLTTVKGNAVRPATDRARGTIFNSLQNRLGLRNADVLDLFAGSGSLGFESLSRGARRAVFVENNRQALDALRQNADSLGCGDAVECVQMDSLVYIGHCGESFDLVFADPPYAFEETPRLPGLIFGKGLVKRGGFLVIEHARGTRFDGGDGYDENVQKRAGATVLTFFSHRAGQGDL